MPEWVIWLPLLFQFQKRRPCYGPFNGWSSPRNPCRPSKDGRPVWCRSFYSHSFWHPSFIYFLMDNTSSCSLTGLLMYSSVPAFRQRSRSPAIACESPVIKITAGVFRKQVVQAFLAGAQGVFCYFSFSVLEMVEGFCKYLPLASQIAAALTIRSKMLPSLRTISNLRSLSQQPFVQLPQGGFWYL